MAKPDQTIVEIPPEFVKDYGAPADLRQALSHTDRTTPCGMPYTLIWRGGPAKGLPVTGFCAEPLCIRTDGEPGECTGPRFVPHLQQYTTTDPSDPRRKQRRIMPKRVYPTDVDLHEIVEAVRRFGEKATAITHVRDDRTDREIMAHVGMTWKRLRASVLGEGRWGV